MKIIAIKTEVLKTSIEFNEDNTEISFQVNTWIGVEGNPYLFDKNGKVDLGTPKTVFNLTCNVSEIADIQAIAESQVNDYITANYPEIEGI
jgi:hypothetical protein